MSAQGPGRGEPEYERRDADRYHTGRENWWTERAGGEELSADRALGSVREPARDTPVYDETDVLVVGGGPAGAAAATTTSAGSRPVGS